MTDLIEQAKQDYSQKEIQFKQLDQKKKLLDFDIKQLGMPMQQKEIIRIKACFTILIYINLQVFKT